MGIIFWWMPLIWIGITAIYVTVYFLVLQKRHGKSNEPTPIAHSDRLTALPEYKAILVKYRKYLTILLISLSITLVCGVILTARPATVSEIKPAQQSRDIMLCLDVSGSVLRADARLVNRFIGFIDSFSGQRFGLTVFNSSASSVIPLNDDYTFINGRLKNIKNALRVQKGEDFEELTTGTLAAFDKGTSLVADGIVSCVNNLGSSAQQRSQSIILATDNEQNGESIITLDAAIAYAKEKNIRIYAIDPGVGDNTKASDHNKLKIAVKSTGGSYYSISDTGTSEKIISDISKQEAVYAESLPVIAIADRPEPFLYVILFLTLISVGLLWRLNV